MRYEFRYYAQPFEVPGKGRFPEKFASGAFDRSVGKVVPLKLDEQVVGQARVISAEVAGDGDSVLFVYETEGPDPDHVVEVSAGRWSFALTEEADRDLMPRDPLAPGHLRINWRDQPRDPGGS